MRYCSTVDKAVELGERYNPDLAILDIRLAEGGLGTEEFPPRLTNAEHMGILYASGHALPELTKRDGHAVIASRTASRTSSRRRYCQAGRRDGRAASYPFPEKFILLDRPFDTASAPDMTGATSKTESRLLRQQAALVEFGTFAFSATDVQAVLTEAARACAEGLGVASAKFAGIAPMSMIFLSRRGSAGMPG